MLADNWFQWVPRVSAGLAIILTIQSSAPPLTAQEPAPKLNIVIVEGEGAVNNIRQRVSREPIVQVEDENHKPIAGAAVLFLLPNQGAGGTFAGGSHSLSVLTDAQGRAVARGIRMNNIQGNYDIHVTASYQGQTANTTIHQNAAAVAGAAAAAGISAKLVWLLIAAGAGVAAGTIAATRGGGSSSPASIPSGTSTPPTVITAGTPTVGGPK